MDDMRGIAQEVPYGIIYRVTNKVNGKRYIGLTTITVKYRRKRHWEEAKRKPNGRFHKALIKHGLDAFVWEEIDMAYSSSELHYLEKYWVKFFDTYSFTNGYNSVMPCEIDFLKSRQKRVGRPSWNKGVKMSEKGKEQIMQAGLSTRFKKGYEFPDETAAKISKANKGKRNSRGTEFPQVSIVCIDTGKIYESLNAAARELGISHTGFSAYFAGKRRSVRGMQWKKVG